jgi:hypothetical protein
MAVEDAEIQESASNAPEEASRTIVMTFRIGHSDPIRADRKHAEIDAGFRHEQGSF